MTPQAAERIADLVREEYDSNPAFRAVIDAQRTTICAWCKRALHGETWDMVWTRQEYLDVLDCKASHGCCESCLAEQSISVSRFKSAQGVNSIRPIAGLPGDCIISLPVDTSPGEGSDALAVGGQG